MCCKALLLTGFDVIIYNLKLIQYKFFRGFIDISVILSSFVKTSGFYYDWNGFFSVGWLASCSIWHDHIKNVVFSIYVKKKTAEVVIQFGSFTWIQIS